MKEILLIIWIACLCVCCSSPTEESYTKTAKDYTIEEQLAIISDGITPPKKETVEKCNYFLNHCVELYPSYSRQEVGDKLALAFDLATKKGYDETFLQFLAGFDIALTSKEKYNANDSFEDILALYSVLLLEN